MFKILFTISDCARNITDLVCFFLLLIRLLIKFTESLGHQYPVMCLIYLYMTKKDIEIGENVASCTITPTYGVEVYVNSRKLKEFK